MPSVSKPLNNESMNSFTYRFTRQCMVPVTVLGVLSFIVPCKGLVTFHLAPLLILSTILTIRIIRRSRKKHPDCNSSIATFLFYWILSVTAILAMQFQGADKGPLMSQWTFAGILICWGLLVCWLIYWLFQLFGLEYRQNSRKDSIKFTLKSFLKAIVLFLLSNVLPIVIVLFTWPYLVIVIGKIIL